jgi:hypothetical protein
VIPLELSCEHSDKDLSRSRVKKEARSMSQIDFWHHVMVKLSLFGFAFSLIVGSPYILMIIASLIIPTKEKIYVFL